MNKLTTHRFGVNQFKLHRLPIPKSGLVLGLVGPNGTGKTTSLQILTQRIQPNFGEFSKPPDWSDIMKRFRGSELQNYYKRLINDKLVNSYKLQNVHEIPSKVDGTLHKIVEESLSNENNKEIFLKLELDHLTERNIDELSGGELQRLAIYLTLSKEASIYIFDEPSSFLDVKQRLRASQLIRATSNHNNYVIVVEHDLSILDYMSDVVHCVYGEPGTFGVVTMPYSSREGINVFLSGYIPTENMRFRKEEINFKSREEIQAIPKEEIAEYFDPYNVKEKWQKFFGSNNQKT
jgi:ATP-binding cassette subfamily E protein 1